MSSGPHPQSDDDLSGKELGGFRILRRLGAGAMADVYLAEQSSLKRHVAVKVLKPHLAADETYVRRFQREAEAAASLIHANIVQIYEVGRVGQFYYLAQEYVQGLNLRQWLERHGAPDLRQALSIMRQVAAALAKAGQHGIVHRDIKPENIMLTRAGEVKVADFGLARVSGSGDALHLTEVGMTLGTPMYMSPEQIEGRPLDPRSDLYSLGVTCYQMLAGQPPFSGDTALSVALQHLKRQPEPLENHRPDLPPSLCRIVHKMLAKSPEHRFASAAELLRELRHLQMVHLKDPWPADESDAQIEVLEAATVARHEPTRRLAAVMKSSSQEAVSGRGWAVLVSGAILAALLGAAVAWFTVREEPLLVREEILAPEIPNQGTALRQWYLASLLGTPEAWQSVIDYFPTDAYWVNRAKQQLALIYLREENYDRALEIFGELASLDEIESEFRAFGLAGQAGILTMRGEYQKSEAVMSRLLPIIDKLTDPRLRQMVLYARRTNQSNLKLPTPKEWDHWLKQHFPEAG
jgi:serine/threonine protein kinase